MGEEELILWLTLGAAARLQGRPLLRPVVHGFLRGVSGAVVTFEDTGNTPILHLSAEEEEDSQDQLRLRVSTCTTCGQHYFEHALADAAREEPESAEAPEGEEPQGVVLPFRRLEEPAEDEWFRTCVPIYSLKAAAGSFSEGQIPEPDGWATFDSHRAFSEEMFVAQVVGKSMVPRIPDGSWCLFSRQVAGSRHGRILVVQHRGIADPETGGSYTVKRYERLPQDAENGQRLLGKVLLKPLNPGFEPIVIDAGDEDIAVMAELLEIIRL